jgi:hypothetical protein
MAQANLADGILRRLERDAVDLGGDFSAFEPPKYVGYDPDGNLVRLPRWKLSIRWIEFECGCRAERMTKFAAPLKQTDPVIFQGLPEQAIYDGVCDKHMPHMNKRLHLDGYVDFHQWHRSRRLLLIGKK